MGERHAIDQIDIFALLRHKMGFLDLRFLNKLGGLCAGGY